MGLGHLKRNRKRDEMLNQRHDEIERENLLMLHKMHEFAKKSEFVKVQKSSSLPSLRCPGGPAQQREYDRIMQSNAQLLNRLRHMQGEINIRRYEEQYEKSTNYVKLACEYPPPLLRRRGKTRTPSGGATLTRLPAMDGRSAAGEGAGQLPSGEAEVPPEEAGVAAEGGELRYVLREDRLVDGALFAVEMATDGCVLAVSIYDEASDRGFELIVDEEHHRQLRTETLDDYAAIADRLIIRDDTLQVAPLSAQQACDEAAASSAVGDADAAGVGDAGVDASGAGEAGVDAVGEEPLGVYC